MKKCGLTIQLQGKRFSTLSYAIHVLPHLKLFAKYTPISEFIYSQSSLNMLSFLRINTLL